MNLQERPKDSIYLNFRPFFQHFATLTSKHLVTLPPIQELLKYLFISLCGLIAVHFNLISIES